MKVHKYTHLNLNFTLRNHSMSKLAPSGHIDAVVGTGQLAQLGVMDDIACYPMHYRVV